MLTESTLHYLTNVNLNLFQLRFYHAISSLLGRGVISKTRGDKVPDLSGIPDLGLCSCLVSWLGLLN